jgi:hypothetical protein
LGMDDIPEVGCVTVVFVVVIFALGFYAGYVGGTHAQCGAAVEAGVARYEVDPRTRETQFVYGRAAEKSMD